LLHTKVVYPPEDSHPSHTNWAQCTVTSIMWRMMLSLCQTGQPRRFAQIKSDAVELIQFAVLW